MTDPARSVSQGDTAPRGAHSGSAQKTKAPVRKTRTDQNHPIARVGTFWIRLRHSALASVPLFLLTGLVLLQPLPWPIPWLMDIAPQITLAGIFFWRVRCPAHVHLSFVFALGLLSDLINGHPLGPASLSFVSAALLSTLWKREAGREGFFPEWGVFFVVAFLAQLVEAVAVFIALGTFFPPEALFFRYLLTTALYPLVAVAFFPLWQVLVRVEE